jgi:predicted DCC family thiol-disulfide oxidoreductase YuxK
MNSTDPTNESSGGTMLFDGDCEFCRMWIRRWSRATGKHLRYEPYQKMLREFPEVTESQCRRAVQLILEDRSVYSGAYAVFKALALAGKLVWLLKLYENIWLFRLLSDGSYRLVAGHRAFFSKLSALL